MDMVDPARVPQRLEEPIAKAKCEQVLHRLLAEIVVDAECPLLREGGSHRVVDEAGGRKVMAERLLEPDARPFAGQADVLQPGNGRRKQRRSGGQENCSIPFATIAERPRQDAETLRLRCVELNVAELLQEVPCYPRPAAFDRQISLNGSPDQRAKIVARQLAVRSAEHGELRRDKPIGMEHEE